MIKGYKLFRVDSSGSLHPLYVNSDQVIPFGTWLPAEAGERLANGKVKAKMSGGLKYRPGWHLADVPLATHIGMKVNNDIVAQHPNTVWCEVLCNDAVDYGPAAHARGINPRTGRFTAVKADLDYIPANGYYKYKTNPNMTGEWIIAGEMLVSRILDRSEIITLCHAAGLEPQPTWSEYTAAH